MLQLESKGRVEAEFLVSQSTSVFSFIAFNRLDKTHHIIISALLKVFFL